jgi:hypothetical protein
MSGRMEPNGGALRGAGDGYFRRSQSHVIPSVSGLAPCLQGLDLIIIRIHYYSVLP